MTKITPPNNDYPCNNNNIDQLRAENIKFRQLVDSLPVEIYWKDKNGVWEGANIRCLTHLKEMGIINKGRISEVLDKTDYQLFNQQTAEDYRKNDIEVMNEKKEISFEENILLDSGEQITLLSIKTPLYDINGEVSGVLGNTINITHIKKIEMELKQAKEKAEMASKAKSEFIANMSHDIRTPLSGVIGLSQILEQTLKNPDEKAKAHLLHNSGEELLHMLNEILDDVRADHLSENDLKLETFDLHQCIQDIIRLETPATTLKQLQLKAHISDNVPQFICSDRNKIHRVLLNLTGNAIKFTQSGSITLSIDCSYLNKNKVHLTISVSDTGIGIPEDMQAQVFNRFFKVSSSYNGIYDGHGLGLHIAQSYVELLGGHITLTSKEGIGSSFNFDLECMLGELLAKDQDSNSLITEPLIQSPLMNLSLLLVEDNLIALKTLELLLSQQGYLCTSVLSGEEALEKIQTQAFDLMICDIGLPGISGIELTEKIRKSEAELEGKSLPIIALTGHARENALQECILSGINEVLSKPAQIEILNQSISNLVKKSFDNSNKTTSRHIYISSLTNNLLNTEKELFRLEQFPLFDEIWALNQIRDKQLLINLINSYLSEDIQQDITQLQTEQQENNWENVRKFVHKIKGGVAYLGTKKMFYACEHLERYYQTGHRNLLDKLCNQIIHINIQTVNELRLWLKNNIKI